MALRLSYAIKNSANKLGRRKLKTTLVILPIIFMSAIVFAATTLLHNIDRFATKNIIDPISSQQEILPVYSQSYGPVENPDSAGEASGFNNETIEKIRKINHVKSVGLVNNLPISHLYTRNLDEGKLFNLQIALIDDSVARLYTQQSFSYQPGQPIPIVLNRNNLLYEQVDWQGKDEVVIDYAKAGFSDIEKLRPVKTTLAKMSTEQLTNRRFTLTAGGFEPFKEYRQTSTGFNSTTPPKETYKRLTAADLRAADTTRRESITPYWEYNKIKDGINYELVVVGIIDDPSVATSYIPRAAGLAMLQAGINLTESARTTTSLPADKINQAFLGTKLTSTGQLFAESLPTGPFGQDTSSLVVPGLVYKQQNDTVSEVRSFQVTPTALNNDSLLLELDNADKRADVIKSLNEQNIPAHDNSPAAVFNGFKKFFYAALAILSSILLGIGMVIVLLTIGRSINESRREIGVWRAIGARRADIVKLFVTYTVSLVLLGAVLGCLVGFGLVVLLSRPIVGQINPFLKDITVAIGQDIKLTWTDLLMPDWLLLGLFLLALVVVAIGLAFIPAWRAARISPVEAIRKAD